MNLESTEPWHQTSAASSSTIINTSIVCRMHNSTSLAADNVFVHLNDHAEDRQHVCMHSAWHLSAPTTAVSAPTKGHTATAATTTAATTTQTSQTPHPCDCRRAPHTARPNQSSAPLYSIHQRPTLDNLETTHLQVEVSVFC